MFYFLYHLPNKVLQNIPSETSQPTLGNGNVTSSHKNLNFQEVKDQPKDPHQNQILELLGKLVKQVDLLTKENLERKKKENQSVLHWNPLQTQ